MLPSRSHRAPRALRRLPVALAALLSALLLTSGCAGSGARDDGGASLPDAETVIARMVAAEGGASALSAVRGRTLVADIHLVGPDVRGTLEQWNGGPGRLREKLTIEPFGVLDQGIDGEVVWVNDPMEGVRILTGDERAATLRGARLAPLLHLEEDFGSIVTTGATEVDGRLCDVLEVTGHDGESEEWLVDREHGLRVLVRGTMETERGTTKTEYHEADYRLIDGLRFPFFVRIVNGPETMEIRTREIRHGTEFPDGTFAMPPEVRRFLEVRGNDEAEGDREGPSEDGRGAR